jgi:hypothetical protein
MPTTDPLALGLLAAGAAFGIAFVWALVLRARLRQARTSAAEAAKDSARAVRDAHAHADLARAAAAQEVARLQDEARRRWTEVDSQLSAERARLAEEALRIEAHYEGEMKKALVELAPLRRFQSVADAEAEAQRLLVDAMTVAQRLRDESQTYASRAKAQSDVELREASAKVRALRTEADGTLATATAHARRLVDEAHSRAEKIAGSAYAALRDKEGLEQAVTAIRNVVEGYGDRYVVPTHSVVDELAADYSHVEAGRRLAEARDHSRRMVEEGHAAECDYAEARRRETAIRFVLDAFNGRVDAILSKSRHDNIGTLEQEIRDAFSLVNLNGQAFRDARILDAYLEARLAELKWAVAAQELRLREREEQRRIQEQIREEEKAQREIERALKDSAKDEERLKKALDQARSEAAAASMDEKAALEARIAELGLRLGEAEAKNQRALSMAQQTRAGNVYVISNVGSFGEDVVKIGMTRRLDPMDRVRELSDASVPFTFDVHAMIQSDDAPTLERELHERFDQLRMNRVNYRKEFFRVPIATLREFVAERGLAAAFTLMAEAREYRESIALARRVADERPAPSPALVRDPLGGDEMPDGVVA